MNLAKKLNRIFYKIGEGFENDYMEENLKDITASFLVSLNICLSFFRNLEYKNIIVPSILIERWNAKVNANINKSKSELDFKNYESDQLLIQNNLTNKLIRTFLRMKIHYNNINVVSYPGDVDNNLIIKINDENIVCNNSLLNETNNLVNNIFNRGKKL